MKTFKPALTALTLSVLSAVALSQATPPTVPPSPTETGQPAAPTSPAELGKPAMPSGAADTTRAMPAGGSMQSSGLPPPPTVQRAGAVEYMSGGAGEESRAVIESMQGRFALRNVFSGKGGQYVVPEKVIVRGASGPATEIANAGPLLVMALPPGKYTIEAAVGGKVQRKTVTLTAEPQKLSWNWPEA